LVKAVDPVVVAVAVVAVVAVNKVPQRLKFQVCLSVLRWEAVPAVLAGKARASV
jgi:hypothetical protein